MSSLSVDHKYMPLLIHEQLNFTEAYVSSLLQGLEMQDVWNSMGTSVQPVASHPDFFSFPYKELVWTLLIQVGVPLSVTN